MTVTAAATAEGGAAAAAVAEWDQGSDSSAHGNARVGTASVVGASLGACVASRVRRVVGPNSVLSWCAGRVRSDVTRFAALRGIAGRVRSRRPVAVPKDPTGPRRARRVRTVFYSLGELMYIPDYLPLFPLGRARDILYTLYLWSAAGEPRRDAIRIRFDSTI